MGKVNIYLRVERQHSVILYTFHCRIHFSHHTQLVQASIEIKVSGWSILIKAFRFRTEQISV